MSNNIEIIKPDQWPQIRDIYLPLSEVDDDNDGNPDRYAVNEALIEEAIAYVGSVEPVRLFDGSSPDQFRRLIEIYGKSIGANSKRDKFRISLGDQAYRCQRVLTNTGPVLALRALPRNTPTLDELRMYGTWKLLLRDAELLKGGLIIVVSTNGQGKTTTCSSVVKTRLTQWAGFGLAVEDPNELPLDGFHGKGRCFQIGVDERDEREAGPGSGYAMALMRALRFVPTMPGGGSIIMVGEIRDARTAYETILQAGNGHLVIATLHAQDIPTGLMRLSTLAAAASESASGGAVVNQMLSGVLRGVIHQRLTFRQAGEGWDRGELRGSILWTTQADSNAREELSKGEWGKLGSRADKQSETIDAVEADLVSDPKKVNANFIRERLRS